MLKYQLGEHRMKKFKDYFQNKIDKVPTWLAELRKLKKKKTDIIRPVNKIKSSSKVDIGPKLDTCWDGYHAEGKKKSPSNKKTSGGKIKMVNNCVKD